MKKSLRPQVADALIVLGQLIRAARADRKWSITELAERAGVAERTVRAVEHGEPGTAAGTFFDIADLVGVPLFGVEDRAELARLRRRGEERLALIPSRVYKPKREIDADF